MSVCVGGSLDGNLAIFTIDVLDRASEREIVKIKKETYRREYVQFGMPSIPYFSLIEEGFDGAVELLNCYESKNNVVLLDEEINLMAGRLSFNLRSGPLSSDTIYIIIKEILGRLNARS